MTDSDVVFLVLGAIIGFFVLLYLYKNNKFEPPFKYPVKVILVVVSAGFFLLLAVKSVTDLYDVADAHRWFVHRRNVLVLVPHDWAVDDTKLCELDGDVDMPVLTCGNYSAIPRKITVHFRGFLPRQGKTSWDCEKQGELISCEPKTWDEFRSPYF
jgi:hypothetical protein